MIKGIIEKKLAGKFPNNKEHSFNDHIPGQPCKTVPECQTILDFAAAVYRHSTFYRMPKTQCQSTEGKNNQTSTEYRIYLETEEKSKAAAASYDDILIIVELVS